MDETKVLEKEAAESDTFQELKPMTYEEAKTLQKGDLLGLSFSDKDKKKIGFCRFECLDPKDETHIIISSTQTGLAYLTELSRLEIARPSHILYWIKNMQADIEAKGNILYSMIRKEKVA